LAKIKILSYAHNEYFFIIDNEMLENIEYFQRDFTLIKSVKKSLGGEMTGLYLLGGLLTHSCTQNIRCVFKVIPQRNH
jgi:hypothetical protein